MTRKTLTLTLIILSSLVSFARADIPSFLASASIHNLGDTVGPIYCPNGQSTALAYVPVGLGAGAKVQLYVAPNVGTEQVPSPGPTFTPISQDTPIPVSGTDTAQLGSFPFAYLVVTTAGSASVTATLRCSASVSRISLSSGATPTPSATYTPYDQTVKNDGPQDFWLLNDVSGSSCPSSFTDQMGLHVLTLIGTGLTCGSVALLSDGEASVYFNNSSSSYLAFPSGVMPSSSPAPAQWTVEYVHRSTPNGTNAIAWFYEDSSATIDFKAGCGSSGGLMNANGTAAVNNGNGACAAGQTILHDLTYTATGTLYNAYSNAVLTISSTTVLPKNATGTTGAIGHDFNTTANAGFGNIEKVAIYTTALTQTKVYAHYFAMRCGGLPVGTCPL